MSYAYSRQITIDHTLCGTIDSANFPVLIKIDDATFKSVANGGHVEHASGYDIGFFSDSAATTPLPWLVQLYDPVNGVLIARVNVPNLDADSDTVLYVCYGDSGIATFQSTATDVYNSDFQGFWDMSQDPSGSAPQMIDGTANANHGTCEGTMLTGDLVAGKIHKAIHFDGTNDAINCGSGISPIAGGNISGSAWVNGQTIGGKVNSARGIMAIADSGSEVYNFLFDWDWYGPANNETLGFNSNTSGAYPDVRTTSQVSPTGWQHVGFTFDGSNVQFYINGNLDDTEAWSGGALPTSGTQIFKIGNRRVGAATYLEGLIEAVRFSHVIRSASWFKAEYNNENDPETFIALGSEVESASSWTSAAMIGAGAGF